MRQKPRLRAGSMHLGAPYGVSRFPTPPKALHGPGDLHTGQAPSLPLKPGHSRRDAYTQTVDDEVRSSTTPLHGGHVASRSAPIIVGRRPGPPIHGHCEIRVLQLVDLQGGPIVWSTVLPPRIPNRQCYEEYLKPAAATKKTA